AVEEKLVGEGFGGLVGLGRAGTCCQESQQSDPNRLMKGFRDAVHVTPPSRVPVNACELRLPETPVKHNVSARSPPAEGPARMRRSSTPIIVRNWGVAVAVNLLADRGLGGSCWGRRPLAGGGGLLRPIVGHVAPVPWPRAALGAWAAVCPGLVAQPLLRSR